jgi:SAM-dependent methyltransferase
MKKTTTKKTTTKRAAEGWHGWDDYAAFYDWENARTVGRRDVAFWRGVAQRAGGRTLELGCGTGRVLLPLAKAGVSIVGIDRSEPMLARARMRLRRLRTPVSASIVRGDIRQLPFTPPSVTGGDAVKNDGRDSRARGAGRKTAAPLVSRGGFDRVIAPYGSLQSLVRERDLTDTLRAVARVLPPGGTFGLDLVPDVPRWQEYSRRVSIRGRRGPSGTPVTLIESVRQDRDRGLTIFDQEFVEGAGRTSRTHRFSLTFRTVGIQPLRRRLERAGFRIDAVLGSYDGAPWDPRADVWVILASKV